MIGQGGNMHVAVQVTVLVLLTGCAAPFSQFVSGGRAYPSQSQSPAVPVGAGWHANNGQPAAPPPSGWTSSNSEQPVQPATQPANTFRTVMDQEMARLSPPAQTLFNQDAMLCLNIIPSIRTAVPQYKGLRAQGYTEHQATDYIARLPWGSWEAAEIAAHAPDDMSEGEIEDRVMRNCLRDAADRASR